MKLRLIEGFVLWGVMTLICLGVIFPVSVSAQTYYGSSCSQYGLMAYESGGYCKCRAGYVFGADFLGNNRCVLADSVCRDQLGTMSRYNSYSGNCECTSGYIISGGQCKSRDSICRDQLGVMSHYSSLSGSCECTSGYVISGGECKSGSSVCRAKHGIYSSYKSYTKTCECDSGYTLNDHGQCVKKQNNVYFKLIDVNTDDRKAIIKSEYDSRQYLITYGVGCLSSTINRYKNRSIVINLGTDYDVDAWDTVILQDDSQTCDIVRRERTHKNTLDIEDGYSYYSQYDIPIAPPIYVAPSISNNPAQATTTTSPEVPTLKGFDVSPDDIELFQTKGTLVYTATLRKCPSVECAAIRYYAEASELSISGKYKKDNWYQVEGTMDASHGGEKTSGWIHGSLFATTPTSNVLILESASNATLDTSIATETDVSEASFWKRIWSTFLGWFKK